MRNRRPWSWGQKHEHSARLVIFAAASAAFGLIGCGDHPRPENISSEEGPLCWGQSSFGATGDGSIKKAQPDSNFGAEQTCSAEGGGAELSCLLRWNGVSTLDSRVTITRARIYLDIPGTPDSTTTQDYPIYRINKTWKDSTATWKTALSSSWEVPGAKGSTDRGPQVGTLTGDGLAGQHVVELNADGIAMVQSWLKPPGIGGVIVASPTNTDKVRIKTKEHPEQWPLDSPTLYIQYEHPCPIGGGEGGSGG